MSDPIGHFLSRAFWGIVGYNAGKARERDREIVLLERERLKNERERLRAAAKRLNDECAQAIANRVYMKLLARLASANIGTGKSALSLVSLFGEATLAQFALQIAEDVRRELRQQP